MPSRARATSGRAATVLATWTRRLITSQVQPGRQAAFLRRHGLPEQPEPDGRMPYATAVAVWAELTQTHDDPLFGAHFAAAIEPRDLGVVGYLTAVSQTLDEALHRVVRFHRTLKDPSQNTVVRGRSGAVTVVDMPPAGHRPWPRHLAEATLGAYVMLGSRFTGKRVTPRTLSFQHAAPEASRALVDFFGCPIRFGQPINAVELSADDVAAPLLEADEALSRYLLETAAAKLAPLDASQGALLDTLRRWLLVQLPERVPTLGAAAKEVARSPRSLQRDLGERGLTFATLLDEVRHEAAAKLFADEHLNRSEIAFLLGFSDAGGLRRAQRRWGLADVPIRPRLASQKRE